MSGRTCYRCDKNLRENDKKKIPIPSVRGLLFCSPQCKDAYLNPWRKETKSA